MALLGVLFLLSLDFDVRSLALWRGNPPLIADLQTTARDPAGLRFRSFWWINEGIELKVEEEQSNDPEVRHTREEVGYITFQGEGRLNDILEVGRVEIDSNWRRVRFQNTYRNPILIAKPLSYRDPEPATVRIRRLTPEGFELRVQEYDYLDGAHPAETVTYLAVETGRHRMEDLELEAGVRAVAPRRSRRLPFTPIVFSIPFETDPVVFTTIVSADGPEAVITRNRRVTGTGFEVAIQREEVNPVPHNPEMVAYLAVKPGSGTITGKSFQVERLTRRVTHNWASVPLFARTNPERRPDLKQGLIVLLLAGLGIWLWRRGRLLSDPVYRRLTALALGYLTYLSYDRFEDLHLYLFIGLLWLWLIRRSLENDWRVLQHPLDWAMVVIVLTMVIFTGLLNYVIAQGVISADPTRLFSLENLWLWEVFVFYFAFRDALGGWEAKVKEER